MPSVAPARTIAPARNAIVRTQACPQRTALMRLGESDRQAAAWLTLP